MKIVTWNVNGIHAVLKRSMGDWLEKESPDVLRFPKVERRAEHVPTSLPPLPGYHAYWICAERKGYSGVATFTTTPSTSSTASASSSSTTKGGSCGRIFRSSP